MYIELEHFARIEMFKTHTHLFTGSHKKKTVDIGEYKVSLILL